MNAQSPPVISVGPLLSLLFAFSSSLPPLVGIPRRICQQVEACWPRRICIPRELVCESVGMTRRKDDLLTDQFDGKQSRVSVDLPLTWHQSPSLITFVFRSREVRRLLLNLDHYGGTDPLDMLWHMPHDIIRHITLMSNNCCYHLSSPSTRKHTSPRPSSRPYTLRLSYHR